MATEPNQKKDLLDTDLQSLVRLHLSNKVLVRDLGRCLGCDSCKKACELRHREARWQGGWQDAVTLEVAPVCHGCAEPSCMAACPRGALVSAAGDKPQVVRDACVGCGLCARACPFGAISCQELGRRRRLPGNKKPKKVAVKCDGCSSYRFCACVKECPTGVLRFVSWAEFLRLVGANTAATRHVPSLLARKWGYVDSF